MRAHLPIDYAKTWKGNGGLVETPFGTPEEAPSKQSSAPQFNLPWTLPGLGLELAWVKPGSFTMGSPLSENGRGDDETQHQAHLTKGFWLGKYPVTQEEWETLMGNNPSSFKYVGKRAPVEQISWVEAMEFCRKLTERERPKNRMPEGYEYTLPTETQWEYASRAGSISEFSFGNSLSSLQANFNGIYPYGWAKQGPYKKSTSEVGSYRANAWDLHDMYGNVWEWCYDWYGTYPDESVTDFEGLSDGTLRVRRGGSWSYFAWNCRSAQRSSNSPGYRINILGFRLALAPVKSIKTASPKPAPPPADTPIPEDKHEDAPAVVPEAVPVKKEPAKQVEKTRDKKDARSNRAFALVLLALFLFVIDIYLYQTQLVEKLETLRVTLRPGKPGIEEMETPAESSAQETASAPPPAAPEKKPATAWGDLELAKTPHERLENLKMRINGAPVELSEFLAVGLETGQNRIQLLHPDYEAWNSTVMIEDGKKAVITPQWIPKPGTLHLRVLGENSRRLGGEDYTVKANGNIVTGKYEDYPLDAERELELVIDAHGYHSKAATVTLNANETKDLTVALEKILGPIKGDNWTIPELGLEMAWIKPGSFKMGSPESESGHRSEENQHEVNLTNGYWLGKYEVTQGEWETLMGNNPSHFKNTGPRAPVETVSWKKAIEFCGKLTEREKAAGRLPAQYEYTLPTEAQWEYACRAGTQSSYAYGDSLDSGQANLAGNLLKAGARKGQNFQRTVEVGSYHANAWGFYDMHGNVWEWCYDRYGQYPVEEVSDPVGASYGSDRVMRGGSWKSISRLARSANRNYVSPGFSTNYLEAVPKI